MATKERKILGTFSDWLEKNKQPESAEELEPLLGTTAKSASAGLRKSAERGAGWGERRKPLISVLSHF